jgi:hypothetical protein
MVEIDHIEADVQQAVHRVGEKAPQENCISERLQMVRFCAIPSHRFIISIVANMLRVGKGAVLCM